MQAKHYYIPPKAKLSEMRFPSQLMAMSKTYICYSVWKWQYTVVYILQCVSDGYSLMDKMCADSYICANTAQLFFLFIISHIPVTW